MATWHLTRDLNTQHQALRQTHAHLKPTRLSHVPLILRVITSQLLFLEYLYPPPPSPSGKAAWRERDTVVRGWGECIPLEGRFLTAGPPGKLPREILATRDACLACVLEPNLGHARNTHISAHLDSKPRRQV